MVNIVVSSGPVVNRILKSTYICYAITMNNTCWNWAWACLKKEVLVFVDKRILKSAYILHTLLCYYFELYLLELGLGLFEKKKY